MNKLVVYSRDNCHLCHDMIEDLRVWQTRLAFAFEVCEIDDDESLKQRFGLMIPVLTHNNDIVCFGRLDAAALTHLLSA